MRKFAAPILALALASMVGGSTTRADAPDLAGRWKLSVLPFGDDEFLIVEFKTADGKGKPTAAVVSTQPFLGPLKAAEVASKGDDLTVTIPGQGDPTVFHGTLKGDKALGIVRFAGTSFPARLEKTDAKEVGQLSPSPARMKVMKAQAEKDPKKKITALLEVIHQTPGHPMNNLAYGPILGAAEDARLLPDEVRKYVETWVDEAKPYGALWANEVRIGALKALQGKTVYAALATELADAAEKSMPADAPLETRGNLATLAARSARLAGFNDVAEAAESRAKEIDSKLDAEYHQKVPPFKPAASSGRKDDPKNGRAVVFEIFTGAQCPPCVAADVGFDALLTTYKPTELIGLQYHLHIPGPDPLANPDAIDRQEYYGDDVRGTPSTFFNGKSAGGGGGSMQASEGKYREFRDLIEPALDIKPEADVTLTADRAGDEIKIVAKASAKGDVAKDAKPRLRLVLVEKSVRYPGGNKLRFHHNVVRGFPGGVRGQALDGGKGEVTATVKLSDLRKNLATYLDDYPKSGRSFPNPLPPIDLDGLAVVALVQDDADHDIWQAVQVPVKAVNP